MHETGFCISRPGPRLIAMSGKIKVLLTRPARLLPLQCLKELASYYMHELLEKVTLGGLGLNGLALI